MNRHRKNNELRNRPDRAADRLARLRQRADLARARADRRRWLAIVLAIVAAAAVFLSWKFG